MPPTPPVPPITPQPAGARRRHLAAIGNPEAPSAGSRDRRTPAAAATPDPAGGTPATAAAPDPAGTPETAGTPEMIGTPEPAAALETAGASDVAGTSADPRVRVGPLSAISRRGAGPWETLLGRRRILVLTDSLAFHGPRRTELLTEPRLWPNVLARELPAEVEVVGRMGWTARDVWWALTKDPHVYSVLLPRADAVILAVGGMDYLPALVPTYLREGIPYLRPSWLRHGARLAYRAAQPWGAKVHNGRWRNLPQQLTDHYLSRSVAGIRYFHPTAVVAGMLPPPHDSALYGHVTGGHQPAVDAARSWAAREDVPMLDVPALVAPELAAGRCNADGLHWSWQAHDAVGTAYAALLRPLLATASRQPGE